MASKYAGGAANGPIVPAGSRVGDGVIAVPLTVGPYHGFVINDDASVITYSAPIGFRVHDANKALHERCAYAIRDFIMGLSIDGVPLDPDLHVVTKVGAKLEQVIRGSDPKQAVYYIPSKESYSRLDNQYDTVRLPVVVALMRESGQQLVGGFSEVMWYREIVHRSMSCCDLGLPEVHTVEIQPGAVIDPGRWLKNYDTSVTTFSFLSEQPAGLV